MNKKKFLVVLSLMVFGVVVWLVIKNSFKVDKDKINEVTPTPTESIEKETVTPTPTVIKETESDTGADIQIISDEQEKIDKEILDLEEKVPIENDNFKLIFDYDVKVFSFVVSFKTNREEGIENLKKWLVENNYGDIPLDQFLIR